MKSGRPRDREVNDKGEVYCKHCDKWKPLEDFPKEKRMPLGIKYKCKKCFNRSQRNAYNKRVGKKVEHNIRFTYKGESI